ncbi:MAG TPA: SpoIIE family protein phosphatase [Coriobacteriia bacterium]
MFPLISMVLGIMLMIVTACMPARQTRSTILFFLLNLSTAIWCGGYFVHMNLEGALDPALSRPGSVEYLVLAPILFGVAATPTFLFLFGAEQAGHDRWSRPRWLAVAVAPLVLTMVAGMTNPWHHLFITGEVAGAVVYGPLARMHHLSALVLGATGFVWCVRSLWTRPGGRRADAVAFGLSAMLPFAGGLAWMTRDVTHLASHAIATPVLQPIANIVLAVIVFRSGLANIVPVGTLQAIMENTDALLGYLDPRLTFVSANSAFLDRVGLSAGLLSGRAFSEVMRDGALVSMVDRASRLQERVEQRGWPDALGDDEQAAASYWNWSLRPVRNRNRLQGFVFSLSEVTDEVRDAELSAASSRLTRRLHSTFDPETTLPRILASAGAALDAEASVVLWDDGRWRWVRRCSSRRTVWETFDPGAAPQLHLAIQARRPVVVSDALTDPRFRLADAAALGQRRILALPLTVHDAMLGAVSFGAPGPGHVSRAELAFGRSLARSVAVAVENARLYQSERRIADTLQDAMASVPEQIEGLETAHCYRSATEAARVGGDFYDIFRVGHGQVALLIGDVSGKGIQVAALTTLVKNTIRSEAMRSASAGTILTSANDLIKRQLEVGTFATAFIALLELETGLLRYASAGHPEPLLARRDGRVEPLGGGSVVLGAFEDATYRSQEAELARGDLLLMFTDGLIETRRPNATGEEDLQKLLASLVWKEPAEVVDEVVRRATEACGGELKDDVAVLAVRLT